MICYEKGEESCPQKDDYIALIRTLLDSDAVIFYTPTYTLSVSGMIKNFFDRSSYLFHRPLFKGKYSLILSCAAVFGEGYALRTLTLLSEGVGFRVLGKIGIKNYSYDLKPAYELRIKSLIRKKCRELVSKLRKNEFLKPTLFELVAFNNQKEIFSRKEEGSKYDREYWRKSGWTDSKT